LLNIRDIRSLPVISGGDIGRPGPGPTPTKVTDSCTGSTMDYNMSTRERSNTSNPSPQKDSTTAKSRRSITSSKTKLERARPRVILLAACLVYLTTTLLAFLMGVVSVSNLVWPEFERVNDQLQAHSSAVREEQIVYSRLDNVLSSRLNRGSMETYEDCLVRGLKTADHELINIGFRYPDVREQVMEWTMENCGRLQYAPQVVNEEPTPQEAVLTYWSSVSYRARQIAEETLGLLKHKLGWVFSRLLGSGQHGDDSSHIDHVTADKDARANEPVFSERLLPQVPFGFALQCQPDQPCRLFYPADSATYSHQPHISTEDLEELEQRTAKLLAFGTTLDQIGSVVSKGWRVVAYVETLFLVLFTITILHNLTVKANVSWAHAREEEMYLVKSMVLEHFSAAAIFMLNKYPGIFPNMGSALTFALIMTTIGLNMLLKFLTSGSQPETVFNIRQALKDLYLIIRNCDIPGEECASQVTTDNDENDYSQDSKIKFESSLSEDEESSAASSSRSPSKPHHRFANPTTTVQEDIRHSRELLRQECAKQTADGHSKVHNGFDTDVESGSDSDAFVHIARDVAREACAANAESTWSMI
jgi:hypothetical protein